MHEVFAELVQLAATTRVDVADADQGQLGAVGEALEVFGVGESREGLGEEKEEEGESWAKEIGTMHARQTNTGERELGGLMA